MDTHDFERLIKHARESCPELHGTDGQLALLISDALALIEPESDKAIEDARALCDFFYQVSANYGCGEYEDEEDEA